MATLPADGKLSFVDLSAVRAAPRLRVLRTKWALIISNDGLRFGILGFIQQPDIWLGILTQGQFSPQTK